MSESVVSKVMRADALAGKVALVTGAARGIGRGVALELARCGADVAVNDLHPGEDAAEVVAAITALGRRATVYQADVSDRQAVEAMVEMAVETFGSLDIMINNAGIQIWQPFLEITDAAIDRIWEVDLKGVLLCSQIAARQMVKQGRGGRIVNISSVHAVYSFQKCVVYDAAKAGVWRMTSTMALEMASKGITVNSIGPGWVDTPINEPFLRTPEQRSEVHATIPIGRVGRPEEIGALAAFLCSEAGAYITGAFVIVDGGFILGQ